VSCQPSATNSEGYEMFVVFVFSFVLFFCVISQKSLLGSVATTLQVFF
jgi:hypothetical protein